MNRLDLIRQLWYDILENQQIRVDGSVSYAGLCEYDNVIYCSVYSDGTTDVVEKIKTNKYKTNK